MIKPSDIKEIEIEQYDIKQIENKIDEEIKKNHGDFDWEEAVLDDEYPMTVRNEVGKRYIENGWKFVYHQTSSENEEKPGLTIFVLSTTPLKRLENNQRYTKVHQCK